MRAHLLKLRKVGNSVEVLLPKVTLARLNVGAGDTVTLTDTPEGGLQVTPATKGREQFANLVTAVALAHASDRHRAVTRPRVQPQNMALSHLPWILHCAFRTPHSWPPALTYD